MHLNYLLNDSQLKDFLLIFGPHLDKSQSNFLNAKPSKVHSFVFSQLIHCGGCSPRRIAVKFYLSNSSIVPIETDFTIPFLCLSQYLFGRTNYIREVSMSRFHLAFWDMKACLNYLWSSFHLKVSRLILLEQYEPCSIHIVLISLQALAKNCSLIYCYFCYYLFSR
jgi:hypothetical protein